MYIKLPNFKFPRLAEQSSSYYLLFDRNQKPIESCSTLPSKSEIISEIELAKIEALEYARSLCVVIKSQEDLNCRIKILNVNPNDNNKSPSPSTYICEEDNEEIDEHILPLFREINLKEFSVKNVNPDDVDANSVYVKIKNNHGQIFFIYKHTLCWLFSKSTTKLGSDRLLRVMSKRK